MSVTNTAESKLDNAMTVDVEDYFQVSAFEKNIARSEWDRIEHRVEQNTNRILDLFEIHEIKATFFVLGWVAERYPELVKRIVSQQHELASHGYAHQRATQQTPQEFREDIRKSKQILEDISGVEILGYRAPSYSISEKNLWAHDEVFEAGFSYSSSVYPVKHDLYGIPDAPRFKYQLDNGLFEIPISTRPIGKRNFPIGGGGFFRLYPYLLSRWNLQNLNKGEGQSAIFYFHPWEIDPSQPKQRNISYKTKLRHYLNLSRMENRLIKLFDDFSWNRMDKVFLN